MFNPNSLKMWATYIPDRNPSFKIHKNKAEATSALKYRSFYEKNNYDFKIIPEDCILWYRGKEEWLEVEFEHRYNVKDKLKLTNDPSTKE